MEPTGNGWRHVLKNYIRSIEITSETAFKQIKQDRIQNHLPFDDSFKDSILGLTSARIATVYTNLLYDEILEDGQNLSNRNDNHQSQENDHPNIGQQMTLTIISAESNTASNSTVNIRPLEVQSIRSELHGQNSDDDSEQLNTVIGGDGDELTIESSKNIVPNLKLDEAFERVPELIDLISDDEEIMSQAVNNIPKDMQSVTDHLQPIVQRRNMDNDSAAGSVQLKKKFKLASSAGTVKRHKCDFCEYSMDFKADLKRHIRTHTNERPYECVICNKRFNRKFVLNGHLKTHRDSFQFHCLNCRQGFAHKMEWKLHESRCKARGYECHLCKKVCIQKNHLVDHMRKHTGEKLRCSKCLKQLSSNWSLNCHMKTHRKLLRFQCSKCRQGFSQKAQLEWHQSHCKAKQYECFLCSKEFHQRKDNLLRHMCSMHT